MLAPGARKRGIVGKRADVRSPLRKRLPLARLSGSSGLFQRPTLSTGQARSVRLSLARRDRTSADQRSPNSYGLGN